MDPDPILLVDGSKLLHDLMLYLFSGSLADAGQYELANELLGRRVFFITFHKDFYQFVPSDSFVIFVFFCDLV